MQMFAFNESIGCGKQCVLVWSCVNERGMVVISSGLFGLKGVKKDV